MTYKKQIYEIKRKESLTLLKGKFFNSTEHENEWTEYTKKNDETYKKLFKENVLISLKTHLIKEREIQKNAMENMEDLSAQYKDLKDSESDEFLKKSYCA